MQKKFNPQETPYIVNWCEGGYHGRDYTESFATLEEAQAAYDGSRKSKAVRVVFLRDWRGEPAGIDLRKIAIAYRYWSERHHKWIRVVNRAA